LPGEFTFRSFMNGKQDLTRAESVMELVSAKTNRAREQAVRRLCGFLEKEISEIKNQLVAVLAGTEIYLDYSEDEFSGSGNDEEKGRLPDRHLAVSAVQRLRAVNDLWQYERIYAEGVLAVLAGRPNAGKSSLFNCLLREDRSIVTNTPGTTRDWIEALISVDDIPVRLADTAGLRNLDSPDQYDGNEIERIGIKRSFELLEKADLVIYLIDGEAGMIAEDKKFLDSFRDKSLITVWNKADLASPPPDWPVGSPAISARSGAGIAELIRAITGLLLKGTSIGMNEQTGPGTVRQKELISTALASTEEALVLADNNKPLDIIAPLFRTAVNALGEITGEISTADMLEIMFARFCVGK